MSFAKGIWVDTIFEWFHGRNIQNNTDWKTANHFDSAEIVLVDIKQYEIVRTLKFKGLNLISGRIREKFQLDKSTKRLLNILLSSNGSASRIRLTQKRLWHFLDINLPISSIFKALDYHSLTKDLPVYGKTKLEIVRLCMRNDPQFKEKLDLYHYFLLEDGKLAVTSELPGMWKKSNF